jgi:multiple sugar transport system substrate-binding protein
MPAERDRAPQPVTLSRRTTLRLLGGAGLTALLAACGGTTATATIPPAPTTASGGAASAASSTTTAVSSTTASQATTSAGGTTTAAGQATTATASSAATTTHAGTPAAAGSPAAPVSTAIVIPDTGAKLPTEAVKFQVTVQGPGPRSPFYKAFFDAYKKAHPNITVQFDELPAAQVSQAIPLAIQNGAAPDIFWLPGGVTGGQAVQQNWIAPLDDVIPNFQQWKAAFPPGTLVEGITMFNGKVYTFPLSSLQRYATLIFYNPDFMKQAGYDPTSKPFTWDDFRAACKKLTTQGAGKYYGLVLGGQSSDTTFGTFVSNFAEMAGAAGGELNWKTGEYNYTSDQFQAATDLLLALKQDSSILPGILSLTQRDATTRMEQGIAAMTLDGPWAPTRWTGNFQFGVASQPLPNSGTPQPLSYTPGGGNYHWLYAKSKYPAVAGDILSYWGSLQGQTAFQAIVGGALQATFPGARQAAGNNAATTTMNTLFDQQMRLAPDPRVRNPDAGQVYIEQKAIHPNLAETIGGLFSGQLSDPKGALKDLQDRADKELDRAIKAAQAKGAKVSRDDWKFANWDPTKDYTDADYKALK